ncbi:HdeD family acid-resistance protein [Mesonia ostreae]|uniref:HdeD family acid-resistance protein n=1 Tax=Mesonia ostreae TaxID=861110 RepID=UPI00363D9298
MGIDRYSYLSNARLHHYSLISSISFALDVKRYESKSWGGLLIFGILGAIFSFILLWNPAFAGLSVVWLIGLSFLFGGLFSIFFALQLRKLHKYSKKLVPNYESAISN